MNEEMPLEIIMRRPATNGPQPCDTACERWEGLPHPHLHFDGLYNEHASIVTLAAYCSCGFCCGEPQDVQKPAPHAGGRTEFHLAVEAHGEKSMEAFIAHAAAAHGINVKTDGAWQKAATRDI